MVNHYVQEAPLLECPICGKKFIPAPEHAWEIGYAGLETRDTKVCSYTCMRVWEKKLLAKKKLGNTIASRPNFSDEKLDIIKSNLTDEIDRKIATYYYKSRFTIRKIAEVTNCDMTHISGRVQYIRMLVKKLGITED